MLRYAFILCIILLPLAVRSQVDSSYSTRTEVKSKNYNKPDFLPHYLLGLAGSYGGYFLGNAVQRDSTQPIYFGFSALMSSAAAYLYGEAMTDLEGSYWASLGGSVLGMIGAAIIASILQPSHADIDNVKSALHHFVVVGMGLSATFFYRNSLDPPEQDNQRRYNGRFIPETSTDYFGLRFVQQF